MIRKKPSLNAPPVMGRQGSSNPFHRQTSMFARQMTRQYSVKVPSAVQNHSWFSSAYYFQNIQSVVPVDGTPCIYPFDHVIHPHSTLRFVWDCFVMVVLVYTCVEIPLTLAFYFEEAGAVSVDEWYGCLDLLISIFLCFDIALNFNTAYYETDLITNRKLIAERYAKGMFLVDFLTSFPWDFILEAALNPRDDSTQSGVQVGIDLSKLYRLIRLFRMLRFFRTIKMMNNQFYVIFVGNTRIFFTLLVYLFFMLFAGHLAGCLFFGVGSWQESLGKDSWVTYHELATIPRSQQYIKSIYWAVVTLFTTGYGDITPRNSMEEVVALSVILLGSIFFAYLIGRVASLVAGEDRIRAMTSEMIEDAQAFCHNRGLDRHLTKQVLGHTEYYCENNSLSDEISVLNRLPLQLRIKIGENLEEELQIIRLMFRDQYSKHSGVDRYTEALLALKLSPITCNRRDYLFEKNDFTKALYVHRSGDGFKIFSDIIHPKKEQRESIPTSIETPRKNSKANKKKDRNRMGTIAKHIPTLKEIRRHHKSMSGGLTVTEALSDDASIPGSTADGSPVDMPQSTPGLINQSTAYSHVSLWETYDKAELILGDVIGSLKSPIDYSIACVDLCEFFMLEEKDLVAVLKEVYPSRWRKKLWELEGISQMTLRGETLASHGNPTNSNNPRMMVRFQPSGGALEEEDTIRTEQFSEFKEMDTDRTVTHIQLTNRGSSHLQQIENLLRHDLDELTSQPTERLSVNGLSARSDDSDVLETTPEPQSVAPAGNTASDAPPEMAEGVAGEASPDSPPMDSVIERE